METALLSIGVLLGTYGIWALIYFKFLKRKISPNIPQKDIKIIPFDLPEGVRFLAPNETDPSVVHFYVKRENIKKMRNFDD